MNVGKWCGLVVLLLGTSSVRADDPLDGFLDPRFGVNGLTLVDYDLPTPSFRETNDLARFSNGRLYQAATVTTNTSAGVRLRSALARVLPNGVLDTTFSGDGKQIVNNVLDPSLHRLTVRVLVQADGKPLLLSTKAAATLPGPQDKIEVCRLTAAGTQDQSFDLDGCANPVVGLTDDGKETPVSMALTPDGGIAILVRVVPPTVNTPHVVGAVYKLTSQGARDDSFGQGVGFVLVKPPACDDCYYSDIRVLNDGSIVLAGNNGANVSFVSKLTASGMMDSSFGVAGHALYSFSNLHQIASSREYVTRLATDSQGRLYTCGGVIGQNSTIALLAVARFEATGQLDPSFGTSGRTLRPLIDVIAYTEVNSCTVDASDRLVLALTVGTGLSFDPGVLRLLPSGEPDTRFNQVGYVLVPIAIGIVPAAALADSLVLDGDGVVLSANAMPENQSENQLVLTRLGDDRLLRDGFE
ncbi:hypothetical protein C7S18_02190 [Ahniella affigens]|uniref:Delta-60 repeat domain-containing protein n=1 Tax=Ahniella affigens TaxID=2021234 RepID=A0A2P1PMK2_9GAMM|nr:hypothetical protein [Ahniella affigens]AVP96073.1 hypothetical protein C7S18_02190 [Ahniella affigens]